MDKPDEKKAPPTSPQPEPAKESKKESTGPTGPTGPSIGNQFLARYLAGTASVVDRINPDILTLLKSTTLADYSTAYSSSLLDTGKLFPVRTFGDLMTGASGPSSENTKQLREQIDKLRKDVTDQTKALAAAKTSTEEREHKIAALTSSLEQLDEKARLGFLLDRIHPTAQLHLRRSQEFQRQFLTKGECAAFVMAVDIRRSTELMLKARSAEQFARFITDLCGELTSIVLDEFGVFDKFTGDGVLAFFPDFYSGAHAAYRVVAAAERCHQAFDRHYRDSRTSFKSVLTDVGLGIGIDYGSVRLVQVAGGLTVVGEPVVYACRLSSAPARMTLLNQPAYEQISTNFGGFCFTQEHQHEIKHEGRMLAYEVRLSGRPFALDLPAWPDDTPSSSAPKAPPPTTSE